jgi:hypothetical protein
MRLKQALVACACVGVVAYLVQDRRAQQADAARLRAEVRSLSRTPEVPRRAVEHETIRVIREEPAAPDPAAAAVPGPTPQPNAPPASSAPAPATPAEIHARFDARFNEERRDEAWAGTSQRTATSRISAVLPATSKLQSIECRASMCRIETTHEDAGHYRNFVRDGFLDPNTAPWNGAYFSTAVPDPDSGKLVATAYLAREGESLPDIQ